MSAMREAMIEYMQRSWYCFPLLPRSKAPDHKLVPQGYLEASNWAPDALYWMERSPDANIGIACHASGLLVVDIDERAGGYDTMFEFERRYSKRTEKLACLVQLTPTGGEHHLFKHPGVQLKGQLGPGVDIKDHGYILAAPSIHPKGGQYEWDSDPFLLPGLMPEAWVSALQVFHQRPQNFSLSPSNEPLLSVPSEIYAERLTGRETHNGWMTCPWHRDGQERSASLKLSGTIWCCFACEPMPGKLRMGGNILDFAGRLWNYALPLRGIDVQEVKDRLEGIFHECYSQSS